MKRKEVANTLATFMREFDLLLTPTLTVAAFPVHMQGPEKVDGRFVDPFEWLSFTLPFNLTGNPAISVPAGWTSDGRPVGLQIVGRHLGDASVISAAAAFERVAGWAEKWPPFSAAFATAT
jgi:aspartyl-tRNA(Asn)/glutamyl-tRNA(Gln) amidotransferase subunit A